MDESSVEKQPLENTPAKPSFWRKLVGQKYFWPVVAVASALLVLGLAAWITYNIAEDRRVDAVAFSMVENPTVGFGERVLVSSFAHPNDGTVLEDYLIDTERLGEVEVNFAYTNARKKHRTKSFMLNIVDRTAPTIYGSNAYTVYRGYQGDLTDLMLSGDDVDDTPRREIIGDYDLNEVGIYYLEYVITDAAGNEARQKFTLSVVEPPSHEQPAEPTEAAKLPLATVIRQHKTAQTKIGIDVSQWQGEIDWEKAKAAGVEFAIVRIGYQAGYSGKYVLDPYFRANIEGATAVGLPVGGYFYSYADSIDEAKSQAEWVRTQLDGYSLELGVAFDWEDWGNFNQAGMSFYTINKAAVTFLDTLSEAGHKGLLYGSKVYLERIWQTDSFPALDHLWQPGKYPVWLAQYYERATYDGDYQIWQMSNTGRVDGIYGDVDIDILYLNE